MPERFTTPVGRFVQGDAFEPQTKDQQGNPRVIKSGPNAGQPNPQYFMAVAFRKDDPNWPALWAILDRVARTEWPQYFPVPGGQCTNPKFAFKVVDGDGHDSNGKPNAAKEGFAGHWIVRFGSSFPPKIFHVGRYQPADQVTNKAELRRGYYVRINGSVQGNKNPTNPGLFVNLDMIEIAGYGPEIVSGPDASEAFGGAPAALPAGASAVPLATTAAPAAPGPTATPPPPAAAPPPVAPPPAPARVMLPAANGASYEALIAAGWTDETLVAHGMMAAPPAPYTGYMAAPPAAPAAPGPTATPPPPAAAPPPVAPPPAPARVMLPAANGASYEALIAAGWTDAQMIQHGMIAA